jgi:hypothetical protein
VRRPEDRATPDRRFPGIALALLLAALGLGACGGDTTTTTVTTTTEPIAPPDAKAEAQIDKIASGVSREQRRTGSSGRDTIAGGESGVPTLSFAQAKSNLSRARYCGNYVVAGPNKSCSFALNVAYDYYANGRPRSFVSYSPVTGTAYRVYCRGKHPTVCAAANNASVYIG